MATHRIQRFNNLGLKEFFDFLITTRSDEKKGLSQKPLPPGFISDVKYTEEVCLDEIDFSKTFESRYDLGRYLVAIWKSYTDQYSDDVGIWAWFAAAYFDQLRAKKVTQKWENFILSRFKPNVGMRNYDYRHSVRTPFNLIKNKYPDEIVKLCTNRKIHDMGDAWENLTSRQTVMTNIPLMNVLIELYYDPKTETIKPGAFNQTSKNPKSQSGKGGARRTLKTIFPRLKKSFDINIMSPKDIINECGKEVNTSKFVKSSP